MSVFSLLEQLATKAYFRTEMEELLKNQPEIVREAILSNDARLLKNLFGDLSTLPDRNNVVTINT